MPEAATTVIAPDVGGGFGVKIMLVYAEEVLVPFAARLLGRPVKWIEDRREHFIGSNHERLMVHRIEVAATKDGRILGPQGPLPLRQRRLLPLRPHQRPVRSGDPAGPLQDPGGAHGI